VRSHITHSMSKKPAFTGLWKCFRRVCFCNYEVDRDFLSSSAQHQSVLSLVLLFLLAEVFDRIQ
jgi:hypothetical protein